MISVRTYFTLLYPCSFQFHFFASLMLWWPKSLCASCCAFDNILDSNDFKLPCLQSVQQFKCSLSQTCILLVQSNSGLSRHFFQANRETSKQNNPKRK